MQISGTAIATKKFPIDLRIVHQRVKLKRRSCQVSVIAAELAMSSRSLPLLSSWQPVAGKSGKMSFRSLMTTSAIEIPYSELSAEALRGVVESFVLREGTDYGIRQHSFEEKIEQVLQQLRRGQAQILFDPDSQSVTIVPAPLSGYSGEGPNGSRR